MGFSINKYRKEQEERRWSIHPVWRGIGCILILVIPIMAWFATTYFLQNYPQLPLPRELSKTVLIPYTHTADLDRVIQSFNRYMDAHKLIYGQFFFTVILMFLGYGILSAIYAIMYRIAGPPRYGPFDVPPDYMRR